MTQFSYVENNGFKNLTVFVDGDLQSITGDHPRFQEILDRVLRGDELENLAALISPAEAIQDSFEKISEQVSIKNGKVLFEGSPVDDVITNHIVRAHEENAESFQPLINFLEKLGQNPNEHSKGHLYRWLNAQDISIAENGDIITYKGVNSDLTSIHVGDGIVDGVELFNKNLPNEIGSVVEMPRQNVTFDPADGCSFGLHAGTWGYASSFGRRVLEVHVNPRDVVSVPTDCEDQKMRTCRYRVVSELDKPFTEAIVFGSFNWDTPVADDEDDDEEDEQYEPWTRPAAPRWTSSY